MLILGTFFFINANVWRQNLIFLFLKETLFITRLLSIIGIAYIKSKKAQKLVGIIRELDLFEEEWRDTYLHHFLFSPFLPQNVSLLVLCIFVYVPCLIFIYLHSSVPLCIFCSICSIKLKVTRRKKTASGQMVSNMTRAKCLAQLIMWHSPLYWFLFWKNTKIPL